MAVLQSCCSSVKMHRFDESKEMLEASFVVQFRDNSGIEKVKEELDKLSDSVKVTFLDYQGTY
jgi:glycine cleavage system regulatory protein